MVTDGSARVIAVCNMEWEGAVPRVIIVRGGRWAASVAKVVGAGGLWAGRGGEGVGRVGAC